MRGVIGRSMPMFMMAALASSLISNHSNPFWSSEPSNKKDFESKSIDPKIVQDRLDKAQQKRERKALKRLKLMERKK